MVIAGIRTYLYAYAINFSVHSLLPVRDQSNLIGRV